MSVTVLLRWLRLLSKGPRTMHPAWYIYKLTWGDFSLCSMDVYLNSWEPLTQLAICSKSPCSIAISSSLQDAIYSSPPLQLSRKVVRTRSEHSSQSAHTLHYVRTHPNFTSTLIILLTYQNSTKSGDMVHSIFEKDQVKFLWSSFIVHTKANFQSMF
jgi:hypothetical protein